MLGAWSIYVMSLQIMIFSFIPVYIACFSCVLSMQWNAKHTIQEDYRPAVRFTEALFPPVSGCTYQGACNYDESAEVDDGSCDFSCALSQFCGEGTEWNSSLSICLPVSCSCLGDLNGNQMRETGDLIGLLTVLGLDCTDQ